MSVFAAAMDRIFTQADMAAPALWISATTSEERPIRIIRRVPDRVTDFGAGRFVSDTTVVDVRVADLPAPRPGDVIVISADNPRKARRPSVTEGRMFGHCRSH